MTPSCGCTITGSAPRSWAPGSTATPAGTRIRTGRAGGVRTRRSTARSSSSPITRARRSRWRAARRSTSSTRRRPRRSRRPARPPDGQDVRIGGGATVIRDFAAAGLDRPHAHHGVADPARPGRAAVGRTGGSREGLRHRGRLLAQRSHARHVHAYGCLNRTIEASARVPELVIRSRLKAIVLRDMWVRVPPRASLERQTVALTTANVAFAPTARNGCGLVDAVRCLECGATRWTMFGATLEHLLGEPCEVCGGETVVERRRPGTGARKVFARSGATSRSMSELRVRLQPRARRDEVVGERDGAVLIRVTAPPVDGKANDALCRLVAKKAGVAPSRVSIVRGHTARDKTLRVEGVDDRRAARRARPPCVNRVTRFRKFLCGHSLGPPGREQEELARNSSTRAHRRARRPRGRHRDHRDAAAGRRPVTATRSRRASRTRRSSSRATSCRSPACRPARSRTSASRPTARPS